MRSLVPCVFAICLVGLAAVPNDALSQQQEGITFACELRGPDSVRFVDDRYVPDRFHLEVTIRNTGIDDIHGATVYALSSRRFTLLTSPSISLDTIRSGETLVLTGLATFLFQPVVSDLSEIDTLTVLVDAFGVRSTCRLPVFIEKERRPRLELICESPGAIVFDELRNEYIPNPFPVRTLLRNAGDGAASNCNIDFAGTARVTPFDGERTVSIARLEPGQEFEFTWLMRPERRDSDGLDTLRFEARGSGGMGGRIVSVDCGSGVFIPAARAAEYICALDVDELRYDPAGKRYAPDPFMVRARVTNVGQGIALGMTMQVVLDEGLLLAPGHSPFDTLSTPLNSGETAGPFVKSIRPLLQRRGDSLSIVVLFKDRFGNTARCERRVWVPSAEPPALAVQCGSEFDTLSVDPQGGNYLQSQFTFHAGIANTGAEPIYNVSMYAFPDPDGVLLIDETARERQVTTALLQSDGVRRATWTVHTRASTVDRIVRLRVLGIGRTATGQYLPMVNCEVPVFVPSVGQARLQCALSTDVTDGGDDMVIAFDTARADYEGIASRFGPYSVFRVSAEIVNNGTAVASPVSATLLLPKQLRLEEGESPTKVITSPGIPTGGKDTVSWLLRPERMHVDTAVSVEMIVSATQANPIICELRLGIAEALNVVVLSIASDLTGVSGGVLDVPVRITPTPGMEATAYQLLLRFDPTLLHFIDVRTEGTLTEYNWRNLHTRLMRETPFAEPAILLIADSTLFTPSSRDVPATLMRLRFRVLDWSDSPADPGYILRSPLEFIRYPSFTSDGSLIVPFVQPHKSDGGKRLTPVFVDGEATLSGDCVLPLSASTRLFPNRPNPFNPVTLIPFYLADALEYRIVLLDGFGNLVRMLDEGRKDAGHHHIVFDAGDLPSGLYFCRLEAAGVRHVQRMMLVK